jgi:ADP-heptose:LPS heptosyltransferase
MSRSTGLQRRLDRYLGNPIALMLGALPPTAAKIENPARIGLIQPTAIGDVIIASGLIAHLRAVFPSAELHLFHGVSNHIALDLLEPGLVGHTVDFTRPIAALKHIRSLHLDVLVDLVPWSMLTALVCRFSGAAMTLGFATPGTFRHLLFARVAEHSCDIHQSENFRALASCLVPLHSYDYRLRKSFPKPDIWLPYDRLAVCHMLPGGSQARAKAWPKDHWVDLAQRLCDAGYVIAFSGSVADRPAVESVVARVARPESQCFSLAGKVTLPELCYVLQHALLAVSVDTSPLHLASALGVPVVGLHGPTLSRRWGAIPLNARNVDATHPAAGYMQFGFETHPRAVEIMRSISVDEVLEAASALLASKKPVEVVS